MIQAISARFPFTQRESLVFYHPSPLERYIPVAPGIEVSAGTHSEAHQETKKGSPLYTPQGKLNHTSSKGTLVDLLL